MSIEQAFDCQSIHQQIENLNKRFVIDANVMSSVINQLKVALRIARRLDQAVSSYSITEKYAQGFIHAHFMVLTDKTKGSNLIALISNRISRNIHDLSEEKIRETRKKFDAMCIIEDKFRVLIEDATNLLQMQDDAMLAEYIKERLLPAIKNVQQNLDPGLGDEAFQEAYSLAYDQATELELQLQSNFGHLQSVNEKTVVKEPAGNDTTVENPEAIITKLRATRPELFEEPGSKQIAPLSYDAKSRVLLVLIDSVLKKYSLKSMIEKKHSGLYSIQVESFLGKGYRDLQRRALITFGDTVFQAQQQTLPTNEIEHPHDHHLHDFKSDLGHLYAEIVEMISFEKKTYGERDYNLLLGLLSKHSTRLDPKGTETNIVDIIISQGDTIIDGLRVDIEANINAIIPDNYVASFFGFDSTAENGSGNEANVNHRCEEDAEIATITRAMGQVKT